MKSGNSNWRKNALPSRQTLHAHLLRVANETATLTRETGSILKELLDGPIKAVPCQQFGSNKVVLRARLTLQLLRILPSELRLLLPGSGQIPEAREVTQRELVVNLFEPSNAPRYAMQALAFYSSDPSNPPTLEQIGEHIGISKRSAHLALQLGRKMRDAGLNDPFVELSDAPVNASRWRPRNPA